MPLSSRYKRPRAYDDKVYQWHLAQVPEKIEVDGVKVDNPARKNAIFLVHGMGFQKWAETTALLRFGFEDALEQIHAKTPTGLRTPEETPPPFICEGYWADYDDFAASFKEEYEKWEKPKEAGRKEKSFFVDLWKKRSTSTGRTFFWFVRQQLKLVNPRVIWVIHPFAWLLYIPLQFVSVFLLAVLSIVARKAMSQVLNDVRIYMSPRGIVERAIIQRIDRRVGEKFLKMIGLDWEFKPLKDKIDIDKKEVVFDRVIWVAHSLGTVISYNVLSDLFHRAKELAVNGTREQKAGVTKFRDSLRRFVTLGSPLDKIAFLFGTEALRPWPAESRVDLVTSSSREGTAAAGQMRDFWVNFYHVLDPVSGSLSNPLICGNNPPINFHIGLLKIPAMAHVAYWRDRITLKYLLSRVYGKEFLPVPPIRPYSSGTLTFLAFLGYFVWAELILCVLSLILSLLAFLIGPTGWVSIIDFLDCVNTIVKALIPFW